MKFSKFLLLGPLLAALAALPLAAQTSSTPATADAAKPSSGIADILKMLDAQVSPDVIRTYIETSPNTFDVTSDDLITLKQHKATDEITVALLKHNSSSAAPAASSAPAATQSQSPAPIRAYVINNGRLDPESYDFFQRYYLMPRTLANVNQTLGYAAVPYGDGFVPYYPPGIYNYGYASAPGFAGGVGFTAGTRNPFNVGPGLQGGFIIRR